MADNSATPTKQYQLKKSPMKLRKRAALPSPKNDKALLQGQMSPTAAAGKPRKRVEKATKSKRKKKEESRSAAAKKEEVEDSENEQHNEDSAADEESAEQEVAEEEVEEDEEDEEYEEEYDDGEGWADEEGEENSSDSDDDSSRRKRWKLPKRLQKRFQNPSGFLDKLRRSFPDSNLRMYNIAEIEEQGHLHFLVAHPVELLVKCMLVSYAVLATAIVNLNLSFNDFTGQTTLLWQQNLEKASIDPKHSLKSEDERTYLACCRTIMVTVYAYRHIADASRDENFNWSPMFECVGAEITKMWNLLLKTVGDDDTRRKVSMRLRSAGVHAAQGSNCLMSYVEKARAKQSSKSPRNANPKCEREKDFNVRCYTCHAWIKKSDLKAHKARCEAQADAKAPIKKKKKKKN
jgi:hypothetical protein